MAPSFRDSAPRASFSMRPSSKHVLLAKTRSPLCSGVIPSPENSNNSCRQLTVIKNSYVSIIATLMVTARVLATDIIISTKSAPSLRFASLGSASFCVVSRYVFSHCVISCDVVISLPRFALLTV